MRYHLENEVLTASINAQGAELCSLRDTTGTEYIWQADPAFWPRHTPVLFPLVGKVTNNTYTHNGVSYDLGQHGFARDRVFTLTKETPTSLTFTLTSDATTHTLYPFDFTFAITYTLEGSSLAITYDVTNTDSQEMGFKLGAHPGFRCPIFPDETMQDYYFEFEKEESATVMPLVTPGYFVHDTETFTGKTLPISPECFAKDAIVLTGLKSKKITLRSKKHRAAVEVDFADFPFLGLWSPSTPSPFVCIEPWISHADYIDESSEWMTKSDLTRLSPGATFSCTHTLRITPEA